MSHLKLTQQAGLGQTDTRGQYCNRIQRPSSLSLPNNGELKADTDITEDRRDWQNNSGNGNELK